MILTLADAIVEHARWLEVHAVIYARHGQHTSLAETLTRIDLAWRAVTRARDEERAERHPTIPRISLR